MTENTTSASAQEIPVPPAGGSWSWDGTEWVSNDPAPAAEPEAQATINAIEQEQMP